MATYTNQAPASLNVGDILVFNRNGNYVLPRGQYKAEVASAKGGTGGYAYTYTSVIGKSSGGWEPVSTAGGQGGAGGSGVAAIFQLALGDTQNALAVVCGAVGTTPQANFLAFDATGTIYGGAGGTGAKSTLSLNGSLIASCDGGNGGGGGRATGNVAGKYPSSVGQTASRSASGSNGGAGAGGTVVLAPMGYTTETNSGAGFIRLTVISLNSPPSIPDPITYGTPLAGRGLALACGLSVDPDPGDTIQYVWEYRTDSGAWVQIAITDTDSATVTVPSSGNNITFRVKAVDNHGAESGYATGSPKVIIYNYPPVISGVDEDRGEIHNPFDYSFSVDDPDVGDKISVDAYLDNATRSLLKIEDAVRNQQYDVDLTDLWEFVSMGNHTLIIHAKDDKGGEAFRRISFTRYSNMLEVELEQPIKLAELITTLIPMINYAAGNDYTFTCRVKNDPAAAWEDVSAFNHLGQIYEFVNDQKTTAGDSEFYCQVDIEKGLTKHPIEFRGGTFVVNANGIEASYADGIRINPAKIASGGKLTSADTNVMRALNTLSQSVGGGVGEGGNSTNNQSMLPVMKSSWAGKGDGEGGIIPDPAVWATDRICTVASETLANQSALPILAHSHSHETFDAPVKYVFLPMGWEEPKAHDTNEPIMAPIDGIFEVTVAQGSVAAGTVVYAEQSWNDPNNDALLNENYGQLTLTNTGWPVGLVVAPGLMKLTVNDMSRAEYVSNANGYYAKFASGLLICWKKQFALTAANTAYNWTYPHAFSTAGGMPVISIANTSNINATTIKASLTTRNYSTIMSNIAAASVDLIAVGCWR